MTNSIENTYQGALLADAAYIDFSELYDLVTGQIIDSSTVRVLDEFQKRGFTIEQFVIFTDRYEVVDYIQDSGSGFSATLFRDTEDNDKITLSFRGTEPTDGGDLWQDLLLFLGLSENSPQTGSIAEAMEGWINSGIINTESEVNVVGHSLGGHLALIMVAKYSDFVGNVTTFNGAGLQGGDAELAIPNLNKLNVTRVVAKPGTEITATDVFLHQNGNKESVFIGLQSSTVMGHEFSAGNHSMVHLVDTLSVARIFSLLDSNKSLQQIDEYLWQAHNRKIEKIIHNYEDGEDYSHNGEPDLIDPAQSAILLSVLMTHLANLLGGSFSGFNTANDAEAFYQELSLLQDTGQGFSLKAIADINDVVEVAATDVSEFGLAVRYSLIEGVPFILVPDSGYDDGIFSQLDDTAGKYGIDAYSPEYWQDRLEFYTLILERNQQDLPDGAAITTVDNEVAFYQDLSSGDEIQTFAFAPADKVNHYVFGRDEGENISGYDKDDRLYGMGGDDEITGQGGEEGVRFAA